jgi:hypothetical protein
LNKNNQQIMIELNDLFKNNFSEWNELNEHKLDKVIMGLRCIAIIGEALSKRDDLKHHIICCKIYDEIFSDGVSGLYLAAIAMDKPANIVLRRIVELGVAAVYLWDMPHMAYSWNEFDHDLSFSEMLKHVNSKGYIAYVEACNSSEIPKEIYPSSRLQRIYGLLSDVVHGKITTFESSMPNRFKFIESEWLDFVNLAEEIVCILVKAFLVRFELAEEVFIELPLAKKEFDL